MIQTKVLTYGPDSTVSFDGPEETTAVRGITIYGKSTQNGIPTPQNPINIVSIASDGSLTVSAVYDNDTASWTVSVNGLRGIKVVDNPYKLLVGNGAYLTTQDGARLQALT